MDAILLVLLLGAVLPLVLFTVALVDLLRRPRLDGFTRIVWVLVLIFVPVLGPVLWFVLRSQYTGRQVSG